MSYNIDNVVYQKGCAPLRIVRGVAARFKATHKESLPETNFLDRIADAGDEDNDDACVINQPWWQGAGSGHSGETLIKVLRLTTGAANLILTWEGGDSVSGLIVKDGVVTEGRVVQTVVPK